MEETIMIRTEHLGKDYRLYEKKTDRLKEAFPLLFRKQKSERTAHCGISA